MEKPFSPSCDRNQQFILDQLGDIIRPTDKKLLEIGSGTGQHAVFMATQLPQLTWQTSDLKLNHAGIEMWINDSKQKNIIKPIVYHAGKTDLPLVGADIVLTVNTLHIMSWQNVKVLIKQLGENLKNNTQIMIYGPFNYKGRFTSESNANFEIWLKQQNSHSGIRDFELIVELMLVENIKLVADIEMPANNRILHFIKLETFT